MTTTEAERILDQAPDLIDQKRFRTALRTMGEVAATCSDPPTLVLASFNLGAVCWADIGDGEAARNSFIASAELARSLGPTAAGGVRQVYANACENLMLLSLSYNEYENWATQLEAIQPENDILRSQRRLFREHREKGQPWSFCLRAIAESYYDRSDPARDRGRYGCALATFQLMLVHRKELRLSRDDWGLAVYELVALAMRIDTDCFLACERRAVPFEHSEFSFIATDALPFAEQYASANPADESNTEMLANLRQFVAELNDTAAKIHARLAACPRAPVSNLLPPGPTPIIASAPMAGQTDAPPAWMIVSGGAVVLGLIGVGLGALQDWLGGTQNGPMVGGLVCGSIGFLIGFTSLRMQRDARGTACDSCHRLFRIEPANPLLPTGGVAMSAASMRAGRAGIGRRCRGCRRVVCSYCNPYRPCPCGNGRFEQIHLVYW